MKLSRYQRIFLYNQYELLKTFNPSERHIYNQYQSILEHGFEGSYEFIGEEISEGHVTLDVCNEVREIFSMYRALTRSRENGQISSEHYSEFQGFDGNDDAGHFGFACFLIDEQGKWAELADRPRNSHCEVLSQYRCMLERWKGYDRSHQLSKDEIDSIARI